LSRRVWRRWSSGSGAGASRARYDEDDWVTEAAQASLAERVESETVRWIQQDTWIVSTHA
jgi:hypothetical protein